MAVDEGRLAEVDAVAVLQPQLRLVDHQPIHPNVQRPVDQPQAVVAVVVPDQRDVPSGDPAVVQAHVGTLTAADHHGVPQQLVGRLLPAGLRRTGRRVAVGTHVQPTAGRAVAGGCPGAVHPTRGGTCVDPVADHGRGLPCSAGFDAHHGEALRRPETFSTTASRRSGRRNRSGDRMPYAQATAGCAHCHRDDGTLAQPAAASARSAVAHTGPDSPPTARCRATAGLPDPACTPGASDPTVRADNLRTTVCVRGYSKNHRPAEAVTCLLYTSDAADDLLC